jgi:carboxypeptidase Taq
MITTPAYQDLTARQQRLHRLSHLQAIAQWDQAANMPAKGNEARSLALAEMDGLLHQLATDPALAGLLDAAAAEPLDDTQRANLREIRRARWWRPRAWPTTAASMPGARSARPTTGPASRPTCARC